MNLKQIRSKKGFTLIELMIVVAIIGILAAVAIPKFADLVTKSKEASVKGNLGAVRSAVSIYYGDTEGINPENLFVGLTTDTRYLPSIGGVPSMGRYEIPRVGGAAGNNIGHAGSAFPLYENASAAGAVTQGAIANAGGDGGPLYYVNQLNEEGELYIDCGHKDTKGELWTSY